MQKILQVLRPVMEDEGQRRGYLFRALGTNTRVQYQLVWNDATDEFIPSLVNELSKSEEKLPCGKPALCALLEVISQDVGTERKTDIERIIAELTEVKTPLHQLTGVKTLPHQLFEEMLFMDFKQQVQIVKKVMRLHQTAAFLIHGQPLCGQQLLVNRLFRLKPQWKSISPIKIDMSSRGVGGSIPHLWGRLADWLKLPRNIETKEIIQTICDRLLTQDVILVFDTVDYMPLKTLTMWLEKFWQPLVAKVEENYLDDQTPRDKHLLMFLVDKTGRVSESNILLAHQFDALEYHPKIPLYLPPVIPFPIDVLDDCIDRVIGMETLQIPEGLTSQILLEKTHNGLPDLVYEAICSHCGHSWEGLVAKWLI